MKVSMLAIVAAAMLATPGAAFAQQYSDSYNFLQAVREGEGQKVTDMLAQPGQTIVNTRDRSTGDGAIHIVARRSDSTYLRFLLSKGANPNLQDSRGNTAAMIAVENSFTAGIDALVRYKADLNLANASGETPLIRAVQMRNTDMVRALLDAGANPDKADNIAGMSARDYAERDNRSPAIRKLIEAKDGSATKAVAGPQL